MDLPKRKHIEVGEEDIEPKSKKVKRLSLSDDKKRSIQSDLTFATFRPLVLDNSDRLYKISMIDDMDILSITSPHGIKVHGTIHDTVAQYVAHKIVQRYFRISQEDSTETQSKKRDFIHVYSPWMAMGIIYSVLQLSVKEKEKKQIRSCVTLFIVRGLWEKFKRHNDAKRLLMRTENAVLVSKNDHQRVCTNPVISKEQNLIWGFDVKTISGENLYGKILHRIRAMLFRSI